MTSLASDLLLQARRQAGLSQRAAARASNAQQPLLSRIEKGRQDPSLSTLRKLVGGCGFDLSIQLEPTVQPHELGLLESTLALTPEQRIDRLLHAHRLARDLRSATSHALR